MTELKTGDLVWVSDGSEESAKESKTEKVFLYKNGTRYICQHKTSYSERNVCNITYWYYAIRPPRFELRVKKASEIMRWLEEHGYEFDDDAWRSVIGSPFYFEMFEYCLGTPINKYDWHPEWLEEVEVE